MHRNSRAINLNEHQFKDSAMLDVNNTQSTHLPFFDKRWLYIMEKFERDDFHNERQFL